MVLDPGWDIAPGRSSQQEIVAYPALNLVVDAEAVTLSGATTRASHRDLRGADGPSAHFCVRRRSLR